MACIWTQCVFATLGIFLNKNGLYATDMNKTEAAEPMLPYWNPTSSISQQAASRQSSSDSSTDSEEPPQHNTKLNHTSSINQPVASRQFSSDSSIESGDPPQYNAITSNKLSSKSLEARAKKDLYSNEKESDFVRREARKGISVRWYAPVKEKYSSIQPMQLRKINVLEPWVPREERNITYTKALYPAKTEENIIGSNASGLTNDKKNINHANAPASGKHKNNSNAKAYILYPAKNEENTNERNAFGVTNDRKNINHAKASAFAKHNNKMHKKAYVLYPAKNEENLSERNASGFSNDRKNTNHEKEFTSAKHKNKTHKKAYVLYPAKSKENIDERNNSGLTNDRKNKTDANASVSAKHKNKTHKNAYILYPVKVIENKNERNASGFTNDRKTRNHLNGSASAKHKKNVMRSRFHKKASKSKKKVLRYSNGQSTRMAPMYLMQQQQETTKSTVKKQKDIFEGDPFILNPYALEEQFNKLLTEVCEDKAEFTSEVVGRTASYIDIYLYKITQAGSQYFRAGEGKFVEDDKKDKKIIFIVHALSPMGLGHLYSLTMEQYLKKLIGYYLEHVDKFDIYLIPLANPDGYLRAKKAPFSGDTYMPLWNKNISPSQGCPGVNVDRNFDVAWNKTVQWSSTCSQHYPGEAPFSEPESRVVRDILHRKSNKIVAYFHVHAGTYDMNVFKGDAVLYPKGFTDNQQDDDRYIDLKCEIDEAIKQANFKIISVSVDTLYNWYGKVTGTSVDYASTVYGIPYCMELVMQLYIHAQKTHYEKIVGMGDGTKLEFYALTEIWKRVIDVIFTNIHQKLELNEAYGK